jgi:hypothetical protein
MTLWNTEHYRNLPSRQDGWFLDMLALVGLAALPGLLFVWLVPLPFMPPVICVISFLIACAFAWFAHSSGTEYRAAGLTAWDVAGLFGLIWIGAAMASDHTYLIRLVEILAMGT